MPPRGPAGLAISRRGFLRGAAMFLVMTLWLACFAMLLELVYRAPDAPPVVDWPA